MKLKELRQKIWHKPKKLALKLGYFPQAICRYESGTGEPNIETLIKLADFFMFQLTSLWEDQQA